MTYRQFVVQLIRNYFIGSVTAVIGVGGVLIFSTLHLTSHEVRTLALTLVLSAAVMMVCELTVFRIHLRPIRRTYEANVTWSELEHAYRQVHRFPILSVYRVIGPHWLGITLPATVLTVWEIHAHWLTLPYRYVYLAVTGSILVAWMHAMIEFFLTSSVISPMLTRLRTQAEQSFAQPLSLNGRLVLSIRAKFQLSALLIGIFPLLLFSLATQVRLSQSHGVDTGAASYWRWAIIVLIVGIGFSIVSARLLANSIQEPIRQLQDKMTDVEAGRFDVRAADLYSDEFARLVAGFNHMTRGLQDRDRLNEQLLESYFATLAAALDARDEYTAGHSIRVAAYAEQIGRLAGFSEELVTNIRKSALLHDIGKIGVRDAVLLKPDRLTPDEESQMQRHPEMGEAILLQVQPANALAPLLPGVRSHHERYDGKGYPDGLQGEAIPLLGRVLAVADAFDAMTSDRPYRKGFAVEKAVSILREGAGAQWDPTFAHLFSDWASVHHDEAAASRQS